MLKVIKIKPIRAYSGDTPVTGLQYKKNLSRAKRRTVTDLNEDFWAMIGNTYAIRDTISNVNIIVLAAEICPDEASDNDRLEYCITGFKYMPTYLEKYTDDELIDMYITVLREAIADKNAYKIYATIDYGVVAEENMRYFTCLEKALSSTAIGFVHDKHIIGPNKEYKTFIRLPGKVNFPDFYN